MVDGFGRGNAADELLVPGQHLHAELFVLRILNRIQQAYQLAVGLFRVNRSGRNQGVHVERIVFFRRPDLNDVELLLPVVFRYGSPDFDRFPCAGVMQVSLVVPVNPFDLTAGVGESEGEVVFSILRGPGRGALQQIKPLYSVFHDHFPHFPGYVFLHCSISLFIVFFIQW